MEATPTHEETMDFFRFVTSVSTLLAEVSGVRYAEVARSIHPHSYASRHAFDGGVSPEDFVAGIMEDEGFLCVAEAADAREYNLAQAALSEFVFETPGWHRSADGVYFMPDGDKTLTIRPLLDKASGRYGFGVEVRDGVIQPGGSASQLGDVESRHAGLDIGTPVEEALNCVKSSRDFRR